MMVHTNLVCGRIFLRLFYYFVIGDYSIARITGVTTKTVGGGTELDFFFVFFLYYIHLFIEDI
jgi:hypothetical protein